MRDSTVRRRPAVRTLRAVSKAVLPCVLLVASVRGRALAQEGSQEGSSGQAGPEPPAGDVRGIPAGFELGVRTGYALPMGNATGASNSSLSTYVTGAVPLWADLGYRIGSPNIFVGGYVSYGALLVNSTAPIGGGFTCGSTGIGCNANWVMLGAQVQYHAKPESSFDPWLGAAIGIENVKVNASDGSASASQTITGWDYLILQVGGDYHGSTLFGFGPLLMLGFGQYGNVSQSNVILVSKGVASTQSGSISTSITNTALHEWLFVGLRGTFDSGEVPRDNGGATLQSPPQPDDPRAQTEDAKLLDQLQALCADGGDSACKALQFATKKRGCCTWHRGARKCDDQGRVVCMDGEISSTCSCSAADAVSVSSTATPSPPPGADDPAVQANDTKLLDQLQALCADGKDGACKALQFATTKRGCCSSHQGARLCDGQGRVVCMDGELSACTCSAVDGAAVSSTAVPGPKPAPAASNASAAHPGAPVPPAKKTCNPNFTVDTAGNKHFKAECFGGAR